MGKQTRSKKSEAIGKGKVTPTQVAYIVDRYLCDNNYSQTRSLFRTEASSLIFNSPPEAPKSLLSLGTILDDYITLKEEKVMLGHERARLEQEKSRVHSLLLGMQEVMNAYNAGAAFTPTPSAIHSSVTRPNFPATQPNPRSVSSAGYAMYQSAVVPASMPLVTAIGQQNMSTAAVNPSVTRKRMALNADVDGTFAAKKTRSSSRKLPTGKAEVKGTQKESSANGSPANNITGNAVMVERTGTDCFVDQPMQSHHTPASSSSPITPPAVKNSGVSSIGVLPNHCCSNNNSPQDVSPTSCTVITSEKVMVSPCKKFAYLERSQEISSSSPVKTTLMRVSKREFIKGRLDFDCSDAATSSDKQQVDNIPVPESVHDADFFDIDFPNLDEFGPNFSFAELLTDLDLGSEGFGCNSQPILGACFDNASGSSPEYEEGNSGSDQSTPEVN